MTADEVNPMRNICVEKVVVNVGVGEAGGKKLRGGKGGEPVSWGNNTRDQTKKTNPGFGTPKKKPGGRQGNPRKKEDG